MLLGFIELSGNSKEKILKRITINFILSTRPYFIGLQMLYHTFHTLYVLLWLRSYIYPLHHSPIDQEIVNNSFFLKRKIRVGWGGGFSVCTAYSDKYAH